jgi:hypothetical protein
MSTERVQVALLEPLRDEGGQRLVDEVCGTPSEEAADRSIDVEDAVVGISGDDDLMEVIDDRQPFLSPERGCGRCGGRSPMCVRHLSAPTTVTRAPFQTVVPPTTGQEAFAEVVAGSASVVDHDVHHPNRRGDMDGLRARRLFAPTAGHPVVAPTEPSPSEPSPSASRDARRRARADLSCPPVSCPEGRRRPGCGHRPGPPPPPTLQRSSLRSGHGRLGPRSRGRILDLEACASRSLRGLQRNPPPLSAQGQRRYKTGW